MLLINATVRLRPCPALAVNPTRFHGTHVPAHIQYAPTVQQSFFVFFFFKGGRDGDDEGRLKSTKDLHRQSHDTLRKPKSAPAFISDTKRETVEKVEQTFAESLRRKTKNYTA